MLVFDLKTVGNKLYEIRTKKLLSRAEVAEAAGLSDRAYADIERGNVNMRTETLLRICQALSITPNDLLTTNENKPISLQEIEALINHCSQPQRDTALMLLDIYLSSLDK